MFGSSATCKKNCASALLFTQARGFGISCQTCAATVSVGFVPSYLFCFAEGTSATLQKTRRWTMQPSSRWGEASVASRSPAKQWTSMDKVYENGKLPTSSFCFCPRLITCDKCVDAFPAVQYCAQCVRRHQSNTKDSASDNCLCLSVLLRSPF